ncbi:MAG: SurA N-terminal domain-containing protein [Spirochaetaceae bacterium]|nr:SurA N-terminal domain-containing protein [Spirochaetaceae bacterium]
MASQTPNSPADKATKKAADAPKRGIKNPFIYAGTVLLLVIVIIAFVFVPSVGGGMASGGDLSFGSYAGKNITYTQGNYLSRQVQTVNDALRQQGLSEQNFQFFAYQVWRQAFERTVFRFGVLDAVKSAGGHVTEKLLDKRMAENPAFQEDGKFSARRFREATMAEKLAIRDTLRDDLLADQYLSSVYGLNPSQKEIAFVKEMAKETRKIEFAAFPLSDYPETEVAAWAAQNAALFRRLTLSRITVPSSENDALKIRKQVESKASSFEDAAKAQSKDSYAEKGGASGARYFHELAGELEKKDDAEKVAALKKGELSPVFKTISGSYVFFRADEDASPADTAAAAFLKDAKDYVLRFERGRVEDWVAAKAKNFAAGAAADFAKAAKAAGVEAKSAGPFPLNYGDLAFNIYGQTVPLFKTVNVDAAPELSGASSSEKFLAAAFGLAPGAVSEPLVLGDNVIVLKVKEAGAALDEDLSGISLYYPYFYQQKLDGEVREIFLKSPKLKDNFMNVFFKYFSPKQS